MRFCYNEIMKKILFLLVAALGVYVWLSPAKTQVKNAGRPVQHIAAFGDSLTYSKGAPRGETYPAQLARLTGREVQNFGLNGDTAPAAAQRLEEVLSYAPDMVLIEFGGNDFMHSVLLEQTLQAVANMIERVQATGAVAVLVDTGGYYGMRKYSKAYKKLAREKGAVFVPGILDGVWGKRGLMSDQIHPNAQGYRRVADKVYKEIKKYL